MFSTGDLLLNIFIFVYGFLWALTMVNAEGLVGWGGVSPAWKLDTRRWYSFLFWPFAQGRPVNFLPVSAIMTFTVSFLLPVIWNINKNIPFTLINFGELVSYFIIFAILEDFIWFLINPYYGLRKFNKQIVTWHPRWLGFLPTDYWIALVIYIIVGFFSRGVVWLLITSSIQLFLTIALIIICRRFVKYRSEEV